MAISENIRFRSLLYLFRKNVLNDCRYLRLPLLHCSVHVVRNRLDNRSIYRLRFDQLAHISYLVVRDDLLVSDILEFF